MNNIIPKIYLTGSISIAMALPSVHAGKPSSNQKQAPNIVLILGDDFGYGDISCNGANKVSTPAIDKLASEGMNFKNFFCSSSLSSPSRYTMLTGRYSWRTSLKSGVLTYYDAPLIKPEQTTLATILKNKGYRTMLIGKWHLGFDWVLKDSTVRKDKRDFVDFTKPAKGGPLERGFDYFFGINGALNMLPHAYMENDHVVGELTAQEKSYDHYGWGVRTPDWQIDRVNEVLTHKAVNTIDDHFSNHTDKPLFLFFSATAIHDPCLPYLTKGQSRAGMRGDMVQELDWSVDEIVKALKRNKAYDNTIIIFTSDNGPRPGDPYYWVNKYKNTEGYVDYTEDYYKNYQPELAEENGDQVARAGWLTYGHHPSGDYRGFKGDAWDGGFRVPFIIRWSNKVKPGSTNNNMICQGDLLATLAELVGYKLKSGEAEDSYSFLTNIQGSSNQIRKEMVICSGGGAMVVYKDGWKFIEASENGRTSYPNGPSQKDFQLFNLTKDPYEKTNLYKTMPEKAAELKAEIGKVEKHSLREDK